MNRICQSLWTVLAFHGILKEGRRVGSFTWTSHQTRVDPAALRLSDLSAPESGCCYFVNLDAPSGHGSVSTDASNTHFVKMSLSMSEECIGTGVLLGSAQFNWSLSIDLRGRFANLAGCCTRLSITNDYHLLESLSVRVVKVLPLAANPRVNLRILH